MQPSEGRAGIDPHVLGESFAQRLVGGERVGLAATAIEREQAQGVEALAQGFADEQVLRGSGGVRRPPDPEQRLDPRLAGTEHEVGEPPCLGGRHGTQRVHHVAQRLAGHEGQSLVEQVQGGRGIVRHRGAGCLGQPREPPGVQCSFGELQHVAGCTSRHPDRAGRRRATAGGVAEGSPEPGHAHLQRRERGLGGVVAPQLGEQPVDGHDPSGVRGQQSEQSALQRRGDPAGVAVHRRRDRTQHAYEREVRCCCAVLGCHARLRCGSTGRDTKSAWDRVEAASQRTFVAGTVRIRRGGHHTPPDAWWPPGGVDVRPDGCSGRHRPGRSWS